MDDLSDEEINEAIWPPAGGFYLHAMLFNVRAALSSLSEAGDAMGLTQGAPPPRSIDQDHILNLLQNAIIHAGAVSRHFWPTPGKGAQGRRTQARGAFLRRKLQIEDSNPLADRKLRNAIEHFDERLDVYLADGIFGVIYPHYVGPTRPAPESPEHIFRAFYTDTHVFQIINERYEIPPLIDELARLESLLEAIDREGGNLHRWRSP